MGWAKSRASTRTSQRPGAATQVGRDKLRFAGRRALARAIVFLYMVYRIARLAPLLVLLLPSAQAGPPLLRYEHSRATQTTSDGFYFQPAGVSDDYPDGSSLAKVQDL